MACLDLVYNTLNSMYRAGSSKKANAGLAWLGPETKSKSGLGSDQAPRSFEFPSCAWLGVEKIKEIRESGRNKKLSTKTKLAHQFFYPQGANSKNTSGVL